MKKSATEFADFFIIILSHINRNSSDSLYIKTPENYKRAVIELRALIELLSRKIIERNKNKCYNQST